MPTPAGGSLCRGEGGGELVCGTERDAGERRRRCVAHPGGGLASVAVGASRGGAAGGHGHVREGATRMRHEMPGPFSGIQFGLADEVGDHLAEAENRP